MIANDYIDNNSKFLRLRVGLGELLLALTLTWFGFVLVMSYDFIFNLDEFPLTNKRIIAYLRNWGLTLLFYFSGSKIGYGQSSPFHGRTFAILLEKNIQRKYISKSLALIIKIVAILFLLYGAFEVLTFIVLFGDVEANTEELIFVFLVFGITPLVFGYKWYNASEYVTRVLNKDLEIKKPPTLTLLSVNDFNQVDNQYSDRFYVIKPSFAKWIMIIGLVLLLNLGSFVFSLTSSFYIVSVTISIILSLIFWKKFSPWITQIFIIDTLNIWNKQVLWYSNPDLKRTPKPHMNFFRKRIAFLFGLDLSLDNKYYIESKPQNLDLNGVWTIFKSRGIELIFSCMAIVFLSLFTLGYKTNFLAQYSCGRDEVYLVLVIILYLLIFSPIFISWLIPVIWTINDLNLKTINKRQTVSSLSEKIRNSQLERFLGFAGLFSGIGYILQIFEQLPCLSFADGKWNNPGLLIIDSVILLMFIALLYSGIAYVICILYLRYYHENIVNKFRYKLSSILPFGTTLTRKLTASEKKMFEDI